MTRRGRISRRKLGFGAAVVAAVPVGVSIGQAFASASSGMQFGSQGYFNNGQVGNRCVRADIVDIADNTAVAAAKVADGASCATPKEFPPGYLGARASGYRDGSFCGQTAAFYTWTTSSYISVTSQMCSNPGGFQSFHTFAIGRFYKGPSHPDNNGYVLEGTSSPAQAY